MGIYDFVDTNEVSEGGSLPSEALQLNGEFIENIIPGYQTLTVSGREAMTAEIESFETGVRDGGKIKGRRFPERTIVVTYQLIAGAPEDFRQAFNELGRILNVQDAELIFNDEPDKYFTGTPSALGEIEPGRCSVTGEIEFLCVDPFKYSVTEYEAEPFLDDKSVLIDYNGTYKAYPTLETDFYKEDEVSEDGETVETLTGAGDCGYVAFFTEDEKIIQLGDPEEADGEEVYAKSQTLINQSLMSASAWGTAAQGLWNRSGAGSLAMKVASYAVPASPKDTSATVLNKKQTPNGSPKFLYSVALKATKRTASAVTIDATVTASLGLDRNYFGRGLGLKGSLYCGGAWRTVTIKGTSAYWKGRSAHSVNLRFTVTGLTKDTASLTGIRFKVERTDSALANIAGILPDTKCSNLPISKFVDDVPETYYLAPSGYGSGNDWHGPTISRSIPADAAGTAGAENFMLTYKQKLSIGSGSSDTNQLGRFQAHLLDNLGNIVAGVQIVKNKAGKTASVELYVNGARVKTYDVDLSYNNKNFGTQENAVKASTIEKSTNKITFTVAGVKNVFVDDALKDTKVVKLTFGFAQYGTVPALAYNGLYWIKFVKDNCNTSRDIPNKFSANDVLEAVCKDGTVFLNGIQTPGLGALGNDWEGFYLTPGLNQIGLAYSEWVPDEYAPTFKVRYREVYL